MPGVAAVEPPDNPSLRLPAPAFGKPVCRLGLATRGDSALTVADVHHAPSRGVDFLNWPGTDDALGRAVAELGSTRERAVVCAQFEARTAADAAHELRAMLATLRTDYLDVLTFYYVEGPAEWGRSPGRAAPWSTAVRPAATAWSAGSA
jgi:hypothetical protein